MLQKEKRRLRPLSLPGLQQPLNPMVKPTIVAYAHGFEFAQQSLFSRLQFGREYEHQMSYSENTMQHYNEYFKEL